MARPVGTKYIETPERMWELFQKYRSHVKGNPIQKTIKGNKNFIVSDELLQRPLTMEGFEVYCFENKIINDLGDYFGNKNGKYQDFSAICAIIKKVIRQDQIEGGMAGIYNPSITQRLNGLVDKTQADDKHEIKINVSRGNRHKAE